MFRGAGTDVNAEGSQASTIAQKMSAGEEERGAGKVPAPWHFQSIAQRRLAVSPRSCGSIAGRWRVQRLAQEVAMTKHAVVIAGAGPTGLMLAAELALAGIDVAVVERRTSQELVGARAGGLHSRTLEVLDQRGIADRFLSQGQLAQVAGFAGVRLDISDFPTRHP